jgi:hypothetical protein
MSREKGKKREGRRSGGAQGIAGRLHSGRSSGVCVAAMPWNVGVVISGSVCG